MTIIRKNLQQRVANNIPRSRLWGGTCIYIKENQLKIMQILT